MMILRLAYRNIWRNRRRTLITIASVSGGLMFSLLFTGIQDGGYEKMVDAAARLGTGHLTLENRHYRQDPDIKYSITDYQPYITTLTALPQVEAVRLRLSGQGMLASSYGAVGIYFDAIDPKAEQGSSPMPAKIVTGTYLSNDNLQGILIGDVLARKLKVTVGSKVVLTANRRDNRTIQELLRVTGIFHIGSDAMDGFYLQMPLPMAQTIMGYTPHEVLQLAVVLKSPRQTRKMQRQVAALLPRGDVVVQSWHEVMADLANYIAMDRAFNYVFQILSFLIIAAGILNTILMSVMERKFEFGVMLALGTTPWSLLLIIVSETAMIGLVGLIIGSLLGWGWDLVLSHHPINLARFMRDDLQISGFALEPLLRSGLYLSHYLIIITLVYLLILAVGCYPAIKAARTIPVDALTARG